MHATIQPAKSAKPAEHHGLSYHPQIRAVLKRGAEHLWNVKDLMELLQLTERPVQDMLASGIFTTSSFPTKKAAKNPRRKTTTGSLLLYLLQHSSEVPQADIIASLAIILEQLPDSVLHHLVTHVQQKLARRASRPVIVLREQEPVSTAGAQGDLFAANAA